MKTSAKIELNVRHLEKKPVRVEGVLPEEDAEIAGLDELVRPVSGIAYDLTATRQGGEIHVEGGLGVELECECARCLKPFRLRIEIQPWDVLLPLEGEEQVSVVNDLVDLTPFVREDIVLSFPQHPLCDDGCRGMASPPQARSDQEKGDRQPSADGSAWAALDNLKF